jgi:hypothetical protein
MCYPSLVVCSLHNDYFSVFLSSLTAGLNFPALIVAFSRQLLAGGLTRQRRHSGRWFICISYPRSVQLNAPVTVPYPSKGQDIISTAPGYGRPC